MSGKELLRRLEKEGWTLERVNASHHVMVRGGETISVPVHANRDLSKGLLNKPLKGAGLK